MAKAHPAKKARFLAGCLGAVGFALTSVAILKDSLSEHQLPSSLLQAPQPQSQKAGINSDAFALQGIAEPAGPEVTINSNKVTEAEEVTSSESTIAMPEEVLEERTESDAESDAS